MTSLGHERYRRDDLMNLDLTFTADATKADFVIAGGPSGVTDAAGNILIGSGGQ